MSFLRVNSDAARGLQCPKQTCKIWTGRKLICDIFFHDDSRDQLVRIFPRDTSKGTQGVLVLDVHMRYVYTCVCAYVYVYIYVYACIYIYMYVFLYVYMYIYMDVFMCVCVCICVYIYMYVYVCVYIYVYVSISHVCAVCFI